MLLKVSKDKIEKINKDEFKLERDLQKFVEENIENLLGLELVKSEFKIGNYRLDTLAYDSENNSFVIIEYKRGSNYSLIDQGYSYLGTILDKRSDVVLEYNERLHKNLRRDAVDWSQSRIIFISQSFTKYQRDSLNFKDLPIELYEVKRYENGLISFDQIIGNKNAASIKEIATTNETVKSVSREIKKYNLEDHYKNVTVEAVELFEEYREKIEEMLPEIIVEAKKLYIAFKNEKRNIVAIKLQKYGLKMWLNAKIGMIDDAKHITKDVSNIGHWGTGDYEITVKTNDELEYILSLVKQVDRLNK